MIEVNKNNFYEVIEKYFTKLSGKIEQVDDWLVMKINPLTSIETE